MTNLTKSDQLEQGKQYGTVQPCGLGTTATNQAAPPRVSIGHNAAADTSPRQAKVNPENDPNLHKKRVGYGQYQVCGHDNRICC